MKLSEYIKYLQKIKNKHGDVEVKVNRTFECSDLSINDTFGDAEKPKYDKSQNCAIIYSEYYDYN